ncbi:MAG: vitamin B12-dependent ribonucleotide reductase [Firmicutes bacterium]|nr:vitamin B12-dependent ribonucleotide reductase [Bacillota bacterium]
MSPELSENALVVLRNRYLAKNERGEVVETPEELFHRVARNLVIIDVLYDPAVYDPAPPGATERALEEAASALGKPGRALTTPADRRAGAPGPVPPFTAADMATLAHAYRWLAERGHLKVSLDEVVDLLRRRLPDLLAAEQELFSAMAGLDFLFNSPTLMNAGRELQQLSACFVLPIEDSLTGIFATLRHTALIHQSGGGTGFSFSRLRPKDDLVKTTGGVASGPVSFMGVYDAATNAIKQGGARRGANMGILRCDHPDILEFISSKTDDRAHTNFNISVAVTDEFMAKVERDEEYALVNPRTGKAVRKLRAREVFDLISQRAWANGEPGVVFIDRINAANPTPHLGEVESTNPCGEQPLLPYESCNLGSINLSGMVRDGSVDYGRLGRVVDLAVHYLDNVIDANVYPLPEIEAMTKANRKIGLGVMGWADLLIRLGVPYDSEEAERLADEVMAFIDRRSKEVSAAVAERRGAFPAFAGSALERKGLPVRRNATTTTIAPTGSISIIAGASGGIEPLFSIAFTRRGILGGQELVEVNALFEETARREGFYSEALMAKVAERGRVTGLEEVPERFRRLFVTALDISPEWHIRMQAAFQRHVDNAVSKTVNLPFEATPEDIRRIYRLAYNLGCKGVTVYRNGSRQSQVLNVGKKTDGAADRAARQRTVGPRATAAAGQPARAVLDRGPWGQVKPLPRPEGLQGVTVRKVTPLGNLYLTLNTADGRPFELFAALGKAGSDVAAFTEAIARLVSLALRCGVDPREIADELAGIGGNRSVGFGPNRVKSVPDAVARFLDEYLSGRVPVSPWAVRKAGQLVMFEPEPQGPEPGEAAGQGATGDAGPARRSFDLCPSCGMHSLAYEEGCLKCRSCGYSEC